MGTPCGWAITKCGCGSCWDNYSPATQDEAATMAIGLMWAATGRQFGICTLTVLPQNPRPAERTYQSYGLMDPFGAGGMGYYPTVYAGQPLNVVTGGCGGGCTTGHQVELPGPIRSIVQVLVDGVVVPSSAYRVLDRTVLVRVDGQAWPSCQQFDHAIPGFEVTYTRGTPIPANVQKATEILACEYAKACTGGECRLPAQITSISRQGVDIQVESVNTNRPGAGGGGDSGPKRIRTYIKEVDDAIDSANPYGQQQRSRVSSPDTPQIRTITVLDDPTDGGSGMTVSSVNTRTGAITLTKTDVGLDLVDNTTDAEKPVSTAQQAALNLKAPLVSPTFTGTVAGVSAAMVGLGNVDNTSDAGKPISAATGIALAGKVTYRGPWAPSTVYAVNDLVAYAGDEMLCTGAHTSAATFALAHWAVLTARPGVFNVKWFGAQGDNVTDDTAAINATVAAAVAYAQTGPYAATVLFPSGAPYLCSSPATATTTNKGNAQIPLPVIPTAGQKLVLTFAGEQTGSALPHWQETTAQLAGSTIRSTIAQGVDGTFGPPSVIGGPTPIQGYGAGSGVFNNILVAVRDLTISLPPDPSTLGMDFSGCSEMVIRNVAVNAATTPGNGEPILATHSHAAGLYTPQTRNNDLVVVDNYSCEGMYFGMILSEHADVRGARIVYCNVGIDILDGTDLLDMGYVSVELCKVFLQAEAIGGGMARVNISALDCETASSGNFALTHLINDPGNLLIGDIRVHQYNGGTDHSDPSVVGGTNARIINVARRPGTVAAPSIPTTGTAFRNPFYRDAVVMVAGGTVTGIAVDGVSTGLTSGTVIVPSGRTITLTYSSPPTWVWTLL